MRLVLIGAPGSGKGTQAERLCAQLGLQYIGTGNLLREAIKAGTPIGREAKPIIDNGMLVPDAMVNELIAELFHSKRPEKFVMDGYPRTYAQAIAFDAILAQEFLKLDAVINLSIKDEEVVRRISSRRCCSNKTCGALYNVASRPPKATGICDKCGSPLIIRDDDKESTVRKRLQEFHKNTDALIDHYRRAKLCRDVSASDTMETIYQNILKQLPQ